MLSQAERCCTSKTTLQNEMASNKYYIELNSSVKSTVYGGYGYCHLRVKASSLVWCLNIRLFDMLQLFQVSLAGPDCRQISHKDCNCSAERQTSLSSRIKAEQLSSLPSASFSQLQRLFVEMWRLLVGGGKNYNVESDFLFQVTVVLFHPQWQWCCFWLGSLLLWIIHLMRIKLQVTVFVFFFAFMQHMERIRY